MSPTLGATERHSAARDLSTILDGAYPGAGHTFANQLPAQPLPRITGFGYHAAAEDDAWSRIFAFFGEHLRRTRTSAYSGSRSSGFSTSSMLTSLKVITRTCLTKRAGRYMSQTHASARRSSK